MLHLTISEDIDLISIRNSGVASMWIIPSMWGGGVGAL